MAERIERFRRTGFFACIAAEAALAFAAYVFWDLNGTSAPPTLPNVSEAILGLAAGIAGIFIICWALGEDG